MLDRLEHKVPPPVWTLLAFIVMYLLARYLPMYSLAFNYQMLMALCVGGAGVLIDLYAVALFIRAKTTVNPLKPSATQLVTSGMYQYSRNPMYLGMLLILAGLWLYLGKVSGLIVLPLFVMVINRLQIIPEERRLHQIFENDYQQYCQQVRRWL